MTETSSAITNTLCVHRGLGPALSETIFLQWAELRQATDSSGPPTLIRAQRSFCRVHDLGSHRCADLKFVCPSAILRGQQHHAFNSNLDPEAPLRQQQHSFCLFAPRHFAIPIIKCACQNKLNLTLALRRTVGPWIPCSLDPLRLKNSFSLFRHNPCA